MMFGRFDLSMFLKNEFEECVLDIGYEMILHNPVFLSCFADADFFFPRLNLLFVTMPICTTSNSGMVDVDRACLGFRTEGKAPSPRWPLRYVFLSPLPRGENGK